MNDAAFWSLGLSFYGQECEDTAYDREARLAWRETRLAEVFPDEADDEMARASRKLRDTLDRHCIAGHSGDFGADNVADNRGLASRNLAPKQEPMPARAVSLLYSWRDAEFGGAMDDLQDSSTPLASNGHDNDVPMDPSARAFFDQLIRQQAASSSSSAEARHEYQRRIRQAQQLQHDRSHLTFPQILQTAAHPSPAALYDQSSARLGPAPPVRVLPPLSRAPQRRGAAYTPAEDRLLARLIHEGGLRGLSKSAVIRQAVDRGLLPGRTRVALMQRARHAVDHYGHEFAGNAPAQSVHAPEPPPSRQGGSSTGLPAHGARPSLPPRSLFESPQRFAFESSASWTLQEDSILVAFLDHMVKSKEMTLLETDTYEGLFSSNLLHNRTMDAIAERGRSLLLGTAASHSPQAHQLHFDYMKMQQNSTMLTLQQAQPMDQSAAPVAPLMEWRPMEAKVNLGAKTNAESIIIIDDDSDE